MAVYRTIVKLKNGKDLLLRNAEESDAEKMIIYLNAVGGESDNLLFGKDGFHLTLEQEREYLKNAKENPDMLMLLGFVDDNLVSMSHISSSTRARIAHNAEIAISVKKEYWHMGIATAGMKELISFAKNKGIKNIFLGVIEGNDNAIRLYERLGFVRVGEHKNFSNVNGTYHNEILMDLYL